MKHTLDIWMNGEHVGKWTRSGSEQSFRYVESYLRDQNARPLSLSLPLGPVSKEIKGPEVASFFDNLLPDNADIRQRIQRRYGLSSSSPFDLLSEIGRDCVGALRVDMRQSIENEWLCLKILEAFGLAVAKADIAVFGTQRTLVVERFDRKLSSDGSWWMRLPQEDLCQALGVSPEKKYEHEGGPGIIEIMHFLLSSSNPQQDRKLFLKTQLLFWLLAAPDGHAKNFSISIGKQGRYSVTPLYDVMSVYPVMGPGTQLISPNNVKMAMTESFHK